jgi:hypothetical protein
LKAVVMEEMLAATTLGPAPPEVKRMLFAAAVRNGNRVSDDQSY